MDDSSKIKFMLRALRHRNFRLFFSGQAVSLMGTWMQNIAMSWLVYRLTGSPFMLGAINFCNQVPSFILGPVAGLVADRFSRHKMIIITQILSMVPAILLAVLTLTNNVKIEHLFIISLLLGCVNAFDLPARQSFVVEMVEDRNDLQNAIALNSIIFNGARLVGPSVAGILIAIVGEGVCFLLNSVSFVAVIGALLAMRIRPQLYTASEGSVLHKLREGYLYAYRFSPIRYALLLLVLVSLMGMPAVILLPVFAEKTFAGGAHTLGFLMGAVGLGAICGAAFLASRQNAVGLERVIPLATMVFGMALLAFSQIQTFFLGMGCLFFAGLGMIVQIAATNTLLQSLVEEDKRGRIMSLYGMSMMGMAPFGNLLAGTMASHIGAAETVLWGGGICVAGALLFARRLPEIRQYIGSGSPEYE